MRPIGLGEGRLGIDSVFEVLGHPGELAGIHLVRQGQQTPLGLAHRAGAHMLRGSGQHGDVLIGKLARGKRLARLRQVLELAGDPDPLGRCPTR